MEHQLTLAYFRGRVALYAILRALGAGKGDEVITQAFTCVAVPEAIMACGARPVYVDLEESGFNMHASDLEKKISTCTKAIVVQHTYGIPADMETIGGIAAEKGVPIIEDCCHTLSSRYDGKTVGGFGIGSFYSFEWGKPVVAGIGGSAVVHNASLRRKLEESYADFELPPSGSQFRLQLQYLAHKVLYRPSLFWPVRALYHKLGSVGAAKSNYNPIGEGAVARDFALKMPKPLQKRLRYKLKKLGAITGHSKLIVGEYRSRIKSRAVSHPVLPANADTVFARYPLLANDKSDILARARKANVELAEWYSTPIHPLGNGDLQKVYYELGSCPRAEERCKQVVTLPTHSAVRKSDVNRAVLFLNNIS